MTAAPLTIRQLRKHDHWLWVACGRCNTGRVVKAAAIPDRFDPDTVRQLHYAGRFRCTGCGSAASATMIYDGNHLEWRSQIERWAGSAADPSPEPV